MTPLPEGNEPWYRDDRNRKHLYDANDKIVALATTEKAAERIVAAINAVHGLPTAALAAGVIDEALDDLLALYECRRNPGRP